MKRLLRKFLILISLVSIPFAPGVLALANTEYFILDPPPAKSSQPPEAASPTQQPKVKKPDPLPKSKYEKYLRCVVVVKRGKHMGTGFFINQQGLIITNYHVVDDAGQILILSRDMRVFAGKLLVYRKDLDLALIKTQSKSPGWLRLAKPGEGGEGSDVIAIGAPNGLTWSVSKGIVSGIRDDGIRRLIQTDAAINKGNSGGPLILTESGNVIGVTTLGFKKDITEGISFAVYIGEVKKAFAKFLNK
jgi:S1-C subfamily serine protease